MVKKKERVYSLHEYLMIIKKMYCFGGLSMAMEQFEGMSIIIMRA